MSSSTHAVSDHADFAHVGSVFSDFLQILYFLWYTRKWHVLNPYLSSRVTPKLEGRPTWTSYLDSSRPCIGSTSPRTPLEDHLLQHYVSSRDDAAQRSISFKLCYVISDKHATYLLWNLSCPEGINSLPPWWCNTCPAHPLSCGLSFTWERHLGTLKRPE